MDEEKALVDASMDIFQKMQAQQHPALVSYMKILPEPMIKGMAQHLARQYLKRQTEPVPLEDGERAILAVHICKQILNDVIQKARRRDSSTADTDKDGAELFYRRALNHMSTERYSDAERLLRRSVEIYPDFADAWDLLVDVFERNGKPELSEQAKLKLRYLKGSL